MFEDIIEKYTRINESKDQSIAKLTIIHNRFKSILLDEVEFINKGDHYVAKIGISLKHGKPRVVELVLSPNSKKKIKLRFRNKNNSKLNNLYKDDLNNLKKDLSKIDSTTENINNFLNLFKSSRVITKFDI